MKQKKKGIKEVKSKKDPIPENLSPGENDLHHNDSIEAFLGDKSNFIDDTPREWVANQKVDGDKLNLRHHSLICHIAIIGDTFPDNLFPDLKNKCNQYYSDRKIKNLGVKPENFYKSVLDIEYSYVDQFNEKKEFETVRKKYIDSNLIEYVTPFINQWYPGAKKFILTLNLAPDKFKIIHYYWIFRKIRGYYSKKSMQDFVNEHCPHVNYNAFKDCSRENRQAEIPKDVEEMITPYVRYFYPEVNNSEN